jgi:hypothetical protein
VVPSAAPFDPAGSEASSFIERVRASDRRLVAVHCPRWLGISNSTRQLFGTLYPVPDDIGAIRRRTRRLFMRVASRDLGTHFARISGLDSGVCICLTALLGSSKVTEVDGFARLLRHIRRDESTHVKKSRAHAAYLGFDNSDFGAAYELTRSGMVTMLEPIAPSFEEMGVDPDRLFKRLTRFQNNRAMVD